MNVGVTVCCSSAYQRLDQAMLISSFSQSVPLAAGKVLQGKLLEGSSFCDGHDSPLCCPEPHVYRPRPPCASTTRTAAAAVRMLLPWRPFARG